MQLHATFFSASWCLIFCLGKMRVRQLKAAKWRKGTGGTPKSSGLLVNPFARALVKAILSGSAHLSRVGIDHPPTCRHVVSGRKLVLFFFLKILLERLVIYCQTTGVSAAHATHYATYCTPCRPLRRAFSGWLRNPPPTDCCLDPPPESFTSAIRLEGCWCFSWQGLCTRVPRS